MALIKCGLYPGFAASFGRARRTADHQDVNVSGSVGSLIMQGKVKLETKLRGLGLQAGSLNCLHFLMARTDSARNAAKTAAVARAKQFSGDKCMHELQANSAG